MISIQTVCSVADNSGAKDVMVIGIYGSASNYAKAKIGSLVKVSVKSVSSNATAKRKSMYQAVVVRTKKPYRRSDGSHINFYDNSVVLLKSEKEMLGNVIHSTIPREILKKYDFLRSSTRKLI